MKFLILFFVLLLSACGIIQDRSSEYTRAPVSKPINIPENLSDDMIQAQYPIPEINNKRPLPKKYELPKPPNATAVLDEAPYQIEALDDQIWLRIYSSPGKVWPLIDAFWREYGIQTVHEDISNGFVVTKSLSDTSRLEKDIQEKQSTSIELAGYYIQAQLSQGIRRNTSEIKLRVLQGSADSQVKKVWQPTSQNQQKDRAVLEQMGAYITSDALQNRYSLLANTIGGESRVQLLQNDEGQNYLIINLSFQRAWNELGKALKAADIVVADKNYSEKKYFISYLNESELGEWYLTESRVNDMKSERNFSLTLEEIPEGGIKVIVEQLNEELDTSLTNELLDLVFEHIS